MKEYNKNAKKFYMVFGILSFIIVILAICYMTQYKNLWFYETVTGITSSDFTDGATTSNLSLFGVLDNSRYTKLLQDFIIQFNPNGSTGAEVAEWAARSCLAMYDQINSVNDLILWLGIISLIAFGIVLVFGNSSRRIYYKSNLIAGIVLPAVVVVFALIVIIQNSMLIGKLAENSDLYRSIDYIIAVGGSSGIYTTDTVATLVAGSGLNNMTFILTDVILVVLIGYSVFLMTYSVKRYNSCKDERNDIIKKAVNANE